LSTTVDKDLLDAVDRFVEQHGHTDRGKVIDDALRLWTARERERATEAMYLAPKSAQEQEEYDAWRRFRRAAAVRLFRGHD
jgi:metal-responsive CopG/Arc/MetJ family transcriptional regulator